MRRRLLATRRLIPLDRLDEYQAAWGAVRAAVFAAGGRAWLFRGAHHQDTFLEFIEWEDGRDTVPEMDTVADALVQIDLAFGQGLVEEWEEPGVLA